MSTQESALTNAETAPLIRPLKILVPLMQQKLKEAHEAGIEHYRTFGEMLWEAKAQVERGRWGKWLDKNFHLSQSTAKNYMQLASHMQFQLVRNEERDTYTQVVTPKTLSEVVRPNLSPDHRQPWYKPVREAVNRINIPQMRREAQNKQNEKLLERRLGLQLIDIGYKVLAAKLHPDRGGSSVAMARLNRVRALLKGAL